MYFQLLRPYIVLLMIVSFLGCTTLKKSISKDDSKNEAAQKGGDNKNKEFLDMEIAPGMVTTTKQKSSNTTTKELKDKKSTSVSGLFQKRNAKSVNTESLTAIQLKFSILSGINAENLSNLTLLQKIEEWWGTAYCFGGATKNCIDCSGLVSTLINDVYNTLIPRNSQDMYLQSTKIENSDLQEGDLVFFHTDGRGISHVGLYITENKFVHASTKTGVTITDLNDKYWQSTYVGAGRILK